MKKLMVLFFIVAMILFVGCGVPGTVSYPFNNDWTLLTVVGVDYSASGRVYTLDFGAGTCTEFGVPMGNGFTYTYDSTEITITGATEEGLLDNTYTYSFSGDVLTLTFGVTEIYTFEK